MKRVVVTGLGCATPLGIGVAQTWSRLLAGECGIVALDKIPFFWDSFSQCKDLDLQCKVAGAVLEQHGQLRTSTREARHTQLALIAAKEAIEDAAVDLSGMRDDTGVNIGVGMSGVAEIAEATRAVDSGKKNLITPFFVPKILANSAAANVSIAHKLRGPNHSFSTACATGAHSIGESYRLIKAGHATAMVCGASESCLNPVAFIGFLRAKAMSTKYNDTPSKASRPFDEDRDGFVMSEGAAILFLEEMEHARERGAKIYAEVVGFGSSGDAYHVTSPEPEGVGMEMCMRRGLAEAARDAGVPVEAVAKRVRYVNAHATSTPMGDLIEAKAVQRVFGETGSPVLISSTKGAVGHLLGAAGAIEALFAVKARHELRAPCTLNLEKPPKNDDFPGLAFIAGSSTSFGGDNPVTLSNSFGFGGTNTSLVFA